MQNKQLFLDNTVAYVKGVASEYTTLSKDITGVISKLVNNTANRMAVITEKVIETGHHAIKNYARVAAPPGVVDTHNMPDRCAKHVHTHTTHHIKHCITPHTYTPHTTPHTRHHKKHMPFDT
jgi:hypothetical protein